MKIGITTFGGDGGKSGISQYIINLLREFAVIAAGDEIEVLVYEDEETIFVPKVAPFTTLRFPGSLRSTLKNIAWHQTALPKLCRQRGYDVLFLPAGNRRLPYSAPCPTVGTVHDFSSLHVVGKYDAAHLLYIKRVLPGLVRRLTQVIAVSECSKRDIVQYARVPQEKVQVILEAADNEMYYPRTDREQLAQAQAKYGIKAPYLLYVARIEHPGKNHVRLIRAFSRLKAEGRVPGVQLVLAGSDWSGAEAVHQEAERSPAVRDIRFTGFVAGGDLPLLYSGAEIFVFPSLYEGFGLPILEAMRCGVPVACADASSLSEVAGDAAVMFDPADECAIAAALETLLTDPQCRARWAERGLRHSQKFTWSETARLTLDLLHATGRRRA
jgi:glycosyltransferase involved in cell wall biosynthesis